MAFRKPTLVPLLFIISATLLLGSLGSWQMMRLQWKNNLNQMIAEGQALPTLGNLPEQIDRLVYRNVALTGKFLPQHELHVVGKIQGAENGFFIYAPFELDDDGRVILVNRGFAPKGSNYATTGDTQTVQGVLRPARDKRLFLPDNQVEKNVWFYEDLEQISQLVGKPLIPLVIEATGKHEANVFPIPRDSLIQLRNDHLHYAITWYSLMIIGLIMFAIYHRVPRP
ncbi:MAG: SURF1 family protein [Rickettsiales bacterium]|nr:SURF1 family protein [Rickettsiales bacterium]